MSTTNTDEIDLRELIISLIGIVKRRRLIILSFLILSVTVGIYQSYKLKPSYTSTCLVTFYNKYEPKVESSVFSSALEVCFSVSSYVESQDFGTLSQLINVPVNEIDFIESAEVDNVVEDKKFKVSVSSVKELNPDLFFSGLEAAINNSDFIRNQNRLNTKKDSSIYAEIITQIEQIDSSLRENKLNADAIDNIYEHRFNLIEKKQELEESLTHQNTFSIGHSTNNIVSKQNKIKEFIKYFAIGLALCVVVVFLVELRNYIKQGL